MSAFRHAYLENHVKYGWEESDCRFRDGIPDFLWLAFIRPPVPIDSTGLSLQNGARKQTDLV